MDAELSLLIARDHPALAGHFPGNPVVPGALLLDETAAAVEHKLGTRIREVSLAKFPAVLHPEVRCTVSVSDRKEGAMRLICGDGARTYLTAVVTATVPRGQLDRDRPQAPLRSRSVRRRTALRGSADIAARLPHAGTMVLIDSVEDWTEGDILCLSIPELHRDNPLRRTDGLFAFCALEYAAQAMALHGALLEGKARPGLLASVRDMILFADRLDDLIGPLWIRATLMRRDRQGAVYAFRVGWADELLVSGRAGVVMTATSAPTP